jgi:hypothetical protein
MYLYVLVCTGMFLWIEAMEAPFWHFEGVASGKHHAPEHLRLPLNTAKCCQGTINDMLLQNMVELGCGPRSACASSPCPMQDIILLVPPYPYCIEEDLDPYPYCVEEPEDLDDIPLEEC